MSQPRINRKSPDDQRPLDLKNTINSCMEAKTSDQISNAIKTLENLLGNEVLCADIHNNLSVLYSRLGDERKSLRHLQCALSANHEHLDALCNMANHLCSRGQYDEALASFKQALPYREDSPELNADIGQCLLQLNRLDEALQYLSKSALHSKGITAAHYNIAQAKMMQGYIEESAELLSSFIQKFPDYGPAHRLLANCITFTSDSAELARLEAAFWSSKKKGLSRMHLAFALCKANEDIGRSHKAYRFSSIANAIMRTRRRYNGQMEKARYESNQMLFDAAFCDYANSQCHRSDQRVVFLVGLPRCGSTLIQQILTMHSNVLAIGESMSLHNSITREKPNDLYHSSEVISRIRETYLRPYANSSKILVDKNLYNFYWIPLIFKAFPNAVVIEIKRERYSHYWSMYKNYFETGNSFTSSLAWIHEFYGYYTHMMNIWRNERMLPINEVSYDDLVRNPRREVIRILELIGLDWEESCLEYPKSKTPVRTASTTQVRKSIYVTPELKVQYYKNKIMSSLALVESIAD